MKIQYHFPHLWKLGRTMIFPLPPCIPPKPSLTPKVYVVKIKTFYCCRNGQEKKRVYISLVFSSSLRYKNKFCLIHMYQARKHMKQFSFGLNSLDRQEAKKNSDIVIAHSSYQRNTEVSSQQIHYQPG